MSDDDTSAWWDSRQVAAQLLAHRRNDVKVNICGLLVPVSGVYYNNDADVVVIELAEGTEKSMLRDQEAAWMRELADLRKRTHRGRPETD